MLLTKSGNFVYSYEKIYLPNVTLYENGLSLIYDDVMNYHTYSSWKVNSEILLEVE